MKKLQEKKVPANFAGSLPTLMTLYSPKFIWWWAWCLYDAGVIAGYPLQGGYRILQTARQKALSASAEAKKSPPASPGRFIWNAETVFQAIGYRGGTPSKGGQKWLKRLVDAQPLVTEMVLAKLGGAPREGLPIRNESGRIVARLHRKEKRWVCSSVKRGV